MSTRIGILGGSFNPVHRDHLAMGEYAKQALGLDKILLVPNALPPHKNTCHTSFEDRSAMLRLAIKDLKGFEVSTLEADPKVKHYSFDTLSKLRSLYGKDAGLFFIMGQDSLLYLDEWRQGLSLVKLANLAVIGRSNYQNQNIKPVIAEFLKAYGISERDANAFHKAIDDPCGHCIMLDKCLHAVSSSAIRQELSLNAQTGYDKLVTAYLMPQVLGYIKNHKLYAANRS